MISGWAGGGVRMLVAVLDDLIDVMGENEDHPLASLMEVIGVLVEKYEDKYIPELTEI
jgi:HTH-type transcriptional regulator/antitoxin HigA